MNRRNFVKAVGSTGIVLSVGGVGTAAAAGQGRREGASAESTITEIVNGSPVHTELAAALDATGLDDVLDGNGQYTLFAPTDDVFPDDTTGLDVEDILLYHVTKGRRYSESVVNASTLKMLNGETVSVDGTTLNGSVEIDAGNIDIEASNGVIHFLNGVLLP